MSYSGAFWHLYNNAAKYTILVRYYKLKRHAIARSKTRFADECLQEIGSPSSRDVRNIFYVGSVSGGF